MKFYDLMQYKLLIFHWLAVLSGLVCSRARVCSWHITQDLFTYWAFYVVSFESFDDSCKVTNLYIELQVFRMPKVIIIICGIPLSGALPFTQHFASCICPVVVVQDVLSLKFSRHRSEVHYSCPFLMRSCLPTSWRGLISLVGSYDIVLFALQSTMCPDGRRASLFVSSSTLGFAAHIEWPPDWWSEPCKECAVFSLGNSVERHLALPPGVWLTSRSSLYIGGQAVLVPWKGCVQPDAVNPDFSMMAVYAFPDNDNVLLNLRPVTTIDLTVWTKVGKPMNPLHLIAHKNDRLW